MAQQPGDPVRRPTSSVRRSLMIAVASAIAALVLSVTAPVTPVGAVPPDDWATFGHDDPQVFYALDLLKGTLYWSYNLKANAGSGAKSICTPAIVGTNVICPYNKYLYDLNAVNGTLTWRSPAVSTSGTFNASAAISGPAGNQVVFAGEVAGIEHAWSLATGAHLFSYHAGGMVFSSTAIATSRIFFAAVDGYEYALG